MPWFLGGGADLYFHSFPFKWILFPIFFIPFIVWSLVWKGLGLYRAARNEHKWWFIAILILNTAGILPIIYLLFFAKNYSRAKK